MKLFFLGTGSAYPTTKRGTSALALQHTDGSVWLFDCGEGTQIQLQKVPVSVQKINKIFITHLHGDHLFGLPGLLCSISMGITVKEDDGGSTANNKPIVNIYGPAGLSRFIHTALSLSHALLQFNFCVHELEPVEEQYPEDYGMITADHTPVIITHPSQLSAKTIVHDKDKDNNIYWELLNNKQFHLTAGWIHHGVPSFGYIIREHDKPGTLNIKTLKTLGVPPGPLYGLLKSGKNITTNDNIIVTPEMVLGPTYPGRTILILGDTSDASPLVPLVSCCDVLVHEATHDDSLIDKARIFGHSTPSIAASIAKKVGASTLLLNHFSQRYSNTPSDDDKESTDLLEQQAENALKDSNISVKCVKDLYVFEVPMPPRHL